MTDKRTFQSFGGPFFFSADLPPTPPPPPSSLQLLDAEQNKKNKTKKKKQQFKLQARNFRPNQSNRGEGTAKPEPGQCVRRRRREQLRSTAIRRAKQKKGFREGHAGILSTEAIVLLD